MDDAGSGQRQRAIAQQLGAAVRGRVLHQNDDAPDAGDKVHGAAHAFHALARNHPVGQVAALGNLHGAEDRQVDVSAANHGEGIGARKSGRARHEGHRLLSGVDEVGVDFVLTRKRAHAEQAVLRLQSHGDAGGNVVGHQRGNADAEIDVEAVLQLLCGAGGHLMTSPCHWSIPPAWFSSRSAFQDWDCARADEQRCPACESHPDRVRPARR